MLEAQFTYKYIAQASGAYGTDAYGSQTYSCAEGDVVCQTGDPGAPNTGIFTPANAPTLAWGFVAVALVAGVIAYFVIQKLRKHKD